MEVTTKNEETAQEIINLLADKKYTVKDAIQLLHALRNAIEAVAALYRR